MAHSIDLPFGGALAYSDDGSGRPVVLIHGWSCSRAFFGRNVGPLSERFRIMNIDLPGHGESPHRDGGHTMEQYARDLNYRDVIGTYSLPTLCVWGRHDQALPVANAAWLAEHVPAEVVILEQSGHCSMWEEPDLFNQAVGDWIASRA